MLPITLLRPYHLASLVLGCAGLSMLGAPANADETSATATGVARSSGYVVNRQGDTAPPEMKEPDAAALTRKPRPKSATAGDYQPALAVSAKDAYYYRVYDAYTELVYDDDGDGHYHYFKLTFDADTDHLAADVYARLYLSLEGGPWQEYFITNVFTLIGASGVDDYEVKTELVSGYPTGYYDLLIELYEAQYDEHIASFGPFESSALSLLPLEDLEHDNDFPALPGPAISSSSGGGGNLGLVTLLCLWSIVLYRGFGRVRLRGKAARVLRAPRK